MDPNRLHLNFGRGQANGANGFASEQNFQAGTGQIYPTTPSTFPQPYFSPNAGHQDYLNAQPQGTTSYFPENGYSAQYGAQAQYNTGQFQQQAMASSHYATRPYNVNDPNAGLAHQFSNQNLNSNHGQNPYGHQTPPNQQRTRPDGSGAGGGHHSYGNSSTGASDSSFTGFEEPPDRDPSKFSDNVVKRVVGLHILVQAFFKDNITRARERNIRSNDLEQYCNSNRVSEAEKQAAQQKLWLKETEHLRLLRRIESPKNFSTLKVIGKGAFGEVKLVQRKADGMIYALKCLVKAEMFKKDQLAHVRAERDILAEADSPWVVKLHSSFQDKTFLYMLMEFLPGGDLMTMLIKYETFAPDIARFYMAEILLAIEAVHKLGFIHRDIKPDNILLDTSGHLKLTDFGLSTGFHKQHEASYYQQLLRGSTDSKKTNRNSVNIDAINLTISNRGPINNWRKSRRVLAYSTVGTPDYIAPEIFSGQGYTFSCDWWSLGAIMYESVIGWPPFCADDPHETYRKIVDWRRFLHFPDDVPLDSITRNLIESLLCDAPSRIGHAGGMHGAVEVKQHQYFTGVDWDSLRRMDAPFKPKLESNIDTAYFPTDEIPQEDLTAQWEAQAEELNAQHESEMTLPFIGYTYRRFN